MKWSGILESTTDSREDWGWLLIKIDLPLQAEPSSSGRMSWKALPATCQLLH